MTTYGMGVLEERVRQWRDEQAAKVEEHNHQRGYFRLDVDYYCARRGVAVSYTHLTLPTTPYV